MLMATTAEERLLGEYVEQSVMRAKGDAELVAALEDPAAHRQLIADRLHMDLEQVVIRRTYRDADGPWGVLLDADGLDVVLSRGWGVTASFWLAASCPVCRQLVSRGLGGPGAVTFPIAIMRELGVHRRGDGKTALRETTTHFLDRIDLGRSVGDACPGSGLMPTPKSGWL